MNTFTKTAVIFVVFLAVLWVHTKLLTASNRALYMSEVHSIAVMVEDANKSLGEGDTDLTSRKLQFLRQRLEEYRSGGAPPELFIEQFRSLKSDGV
jgi:hypothetical protein